MFLQRVLYIMRVIANIAKIDTKNIFLDVFCITGFYFCENRMFLTKKTLLSH